MSLKEYRMLSVECRLSGAVCPTPKVDFLTVQCRMFYVECRMLSVNVVCRMSNVVCPMSKYEVTSHNPVKNGGSLWFEPLNILRFKSAPCPVTTV